MKQLKKTGDSIYIDIWPTQNDYLTTKYEISSFVGTQLVDVSVLDHPPLAEATNLSNIM